MGMLEDFVMDAEALQGEEAVPPQDVVPCLEACKSCLAGDVEDCIECEDCETTIKGTADLLIFEAENRQPEAEVEELWESEEADEMAEMNEDSWESEESAEMDEDLWADQEADEMAEMTE